MELYFENMTPKAGTTEKLVHDLMTLVHDAEDLVAATAENGAARTRQELRAALEKLRASAGKFREKTATTARVTDRVIRDHPYQSLGFALGIGVLIGVLVARR